MLSLKTPDTAAEFQRTGLQKLSAEELSALNEWLTQSVAKVYGAAGSATAIKEATPAPDNVIETQIEGDFEG